MTDAMTLEMWQCLKANILSPAIRATWIDRQLVVKEVELLREANAKLREENEDWKGAMARVHAAKRCAKQQNLCEHCGRLLINRG